MNEEMLKKHSQRERQARRAVEIFSEQKSPELFQRNQGVENFKDNFENQLLKRTSEAEKDKNQAYEANQAKSEFYQI